MKRWLPGCSIVLTCLALMCLLCGCDGQPITDDTGRPKPLFAPMPQFNPPGGAFAAAVTVEITCADSDAAIYYTTDGSTPSDTNGTLYTGPIVLATTTTLQACAYVGASMPSLVASGVYTIASNAPPTLGNATVIGSPRPGSDTSITILCTATDADGYVKSVVADLSSLGGVTAQQMVKGPGGQWNWSGTVRAATAGRKEIRLTAADNQGALASTVTYVDATAPLGMEKWRLSTQGPILSSPAIAADGTIYVGSSDRNLYALAPDGSRKWSFPAGSAIAGTPAIGVDGTVYFAVSGKVYAVTPSGSVKWSAPINGDVYGSVAIGARGMIYVGATSGTLSAFNANGTLAWQLNLGSSIECSPSIDAQGTVHVGTFDGKLHAIYAGGRPKWTFSAGSTIMASPAIGPDGTVYVGAMNGTVYAINPDGTQKWGVQRGAMVLSSAAIDASNTLYVGANNGTLAALDVATGTIKWEFLTAGAVTSSPALAADGTVYFGSADGTMYAVDSQGKEKWRFKTQGQVIGSAAIASDGTVYIGSADRQLYAIAATVGPASGPWPTYRAGQKRTGAASGLPAGNISPIVSKASATGTLVMGRSSSLSLSCYAVDPDGLLTAVTADLSRVMAGASQTLLQGANDTWSWSGSIVPDTYGDKTITFTTTDADGETRSQAIPVHIFAPPQFVDVAVFGDLIGATETEVTVRCVLEDLDAAAYPAVKVDLSAIGGAAAQVLTPDPTTPNRFVWTGLLTPPAHGTYPVLFTATDADNLVENLSYNVTVRNAVPQLGILSVVGRPVINENSPVIISVTASDVDGTVTSVTADLSQIGGPVDPQPLTNTAGDVWSLSTAVVAPQLGVWPVKIVATDDSGDTVETIWQVTVVGRPAISNIEFFANPSPLNGGIESEVTVRCIVVDPQDALVPPVLIDLSDIGGPAGRAMVADATVQNRFVWTGHVTPQRSGNRQITIRATNMDSLTSVVPHIEFVDNEPKLSNLALTGVLLVDTDCTITLSCSSVDVDGRIQQVTADLSNIGGSAAQALQPIGGGQYRWTGTVRPLSYGFQDIPLTVQYDPGIAAIYPFTAKVVYANPIGGQDVVYSGELLANNAKTITVRCGANDPAEIQQIWADLSWLGGSNVQVLTNKGGNTWSWTGEVWPSVVGDAIVTFTATTTYGTVVTVQKVVTVTGTVPLLSSVQMTGSVLADLASPLTITCRAEDPSGITGVKADLSELGVPAEATFAFNSVTGLWVWSGTVMPTTFGDKSITITAAAGSGMTNTVTVTVPVHAASKWAAPLSLGGVVESSPAVSPDGSTVYIGSGDGNLYAVNDSGTVKWSRSLGASVQSSPAVSSDGSMIYVGSGKDSLYAITAENNQAWSCPIGSRVYSSPALSPDELTVYVGADDGNVYAVDAALGTIKAGWPVAAGGKVVSSPAVSDIDGTVYVGSYGGQLHAINPDGAAKWAAPFQAAGLIWSSPAIGRSPNPGDPATSYRVYFASFGATPTGSTLYALDQDGNEKWSFPLGGTSAYSSPVIGPDGTIYIGSDGGKLYAIDPQDGLTVTQRKKWECTLDGAVRSVPAVGQAAGRVTVYVGTSGGTLYAVDPADGSIEWSFQTGDQIRSSVLLTSDGSLYVASYDWNLYAIDVAGGPAPSSWPMFRGGQLRQGLPQ